MKINYKTEGTGSPILIVHGWGGNMNSLKGIHNLAKESYQSTVIDLPGFGESDMPEKDWGVQKYAESLVEFIKNNYCEPITYIGHSFGGTLGIYIAANYPELIHNLILCAPSFKREPNVSRSARLIGRIPGYHSIKDSLTPLRRIAYRLLYRSSDAFQHIELEPNFRKIITEDVREEVSKVTCPILVIWGDQDTYATADGAYLIEEQNTHSTVRVYQGANHALPIVEPDKVYTEINKFIKENNA